MQTAEWTTIVASVLERPCSRATAQVRQLYALRLRYIFSLAHRAAFVRSAAILLQLQPSLFAVFMHVFPLGLLYTPLPFLVLASPPLFVVVVATPF